MSDGEDTGSQKISLTREPGGYHTIHMAPADDAVRLFFRMSMS